MPANNHKSPSTVVSVNNLALTAETLSKRSTTGSTKGKANIDIKVALPLSDVDMTETKVNTMAIPRMPKNDPLKNNEVSLIGKPTKTAIQAITAKKTKHKNTKL